MHLFHWVAIVGSLVFLSYHNLSKVFYQTYIMFQSLGLWYKDERNNLWSLGAPKESRLYYNINTSEMWKRTIRTYMTNDSGGRGSLKRRWMKGDIQATHGIMRTFFGLSSGVKRVFYTRNRTVRGKSGWHLVVFLEQIIIWVNEETKSMWNEQGFLLFHYFPFFYNVHKCTVLK